jgi:hypothetical protein
MILGKNKKKIFISIVIFFNLIFSLNAEDKISTVPLVNLENLKPSFENEEATNQNNLQKEKIILKEKIKIKNKSNKIKVNITALDKITAKTSDIGILIGETKKFGLLEIKALKCGSVNSLNEPGEAAYLQVKDLSDNRNNKIFVFNGWTFSSSPSLKPLDHPIYDLWLVGCDNV